MIKIDSIKGNVIKFDMDNYFPSNTKEKTQYIKTDDIIKICEKLIGSELGIEIHTIDNTENFNLCFDESFTNFMAVELIFGIAPTSHEYLLERLIQLL